MASASPSDASDKGFVLSLDVGTTKIRAFVYRARHGTAGDGARGSSWFQSQKEKV